MLSFGRNPGQYVVIGDNIVVQVVSMDGDLRLAIEAPKEIPIVRGEVYEQQNPAPDCVKKFGEEKSQREKKGRPGGGKRIGIMQEKQSCRTVLKRG